MARKRSWWVGSILLATGLGIALGPARVLAVGGDGPAGAESNPDRTLSPYFAVEGAEPGVEALPLESTRARAHIAGVIADVVVEQTYRNRGSQAISARYVFPASTRAAVYGMKMTIGERVITAKIKEREEARAEYEQAKAEGKTASLLEEQRPNVFSMNVANIMPGDLIRVELRYTELLVPTDGVYELVYPTVVGPRYVSESVDPRAAENQFAASPYRHQGQAPDYALGIEVDIAAGMPIRGLESPSHAIHTRWGAQHASAAISLDAAEASGGNRDFVLRYRLSGPELASGLLLQEGAGENFFLMMVQPPERPAPDQIPPREYVFIVDVSGSMSGFPLDTGKALMRDLLGRLRPQDRFNVLLFAGDSDLYAEGSVPASAQAIADATAFVDRSAGGGGTELLAAVQRAMGLPGAEESGVSRTFVVVTDGYIAEEPQVFEQIRNHLGEANVFAFGIGESVNRHLIDGLARAGQGESFVVEGEEGAPAAASRFAAYVAAPVLTDVALKMDGFEAYDVSPASLPDVFANRPVVVFGKWRGKPAGNIELTGISGRGRFVNTFDVARYAPDSESGALAQLWARTRVAELSDFYQGDANREAVVALGLRYNLLTRFTSFIAVQHIVRSDGNSLDVDQALPMPAGVSDEAIGIEGGAEPPLVWLLLGLAMMGFGWQWRNRRRAVRAS